MKKKTVMAISLSVIISVALGGLFLFLYCNGVFISGSSAKVGAEALEFNGRTYIPVGSDNYTEGKTIARDGDWKIKEIKQDPSHSFVVARSYTDQTLYVAEDYTVPASGAITKAYWNRREIKDTAFLDTISEIIAKKETTFSFETDGIFTVTDSQKLRKLYLAYENCPVATFFCGYLGKANGKWVITTSENTFGTVECYEIPLNYTESLEKYFG